MKRGRDYKRLLVGIFLTSCIFITYANAQVFKNKNLQQNKNVTPLLQKQTSETEIPKSQRGSLVNLLVGGYNIPAPNTLEITISAVSGPNNGRLTPDEERKTEVVVYIPLPKELSKGKPPAFTHERRTFSLNNPQIRKKYLRGSTLYTIKLTNITSGGEFKVIVDPNNRIPEQNENDNKKTFKISSRSFASSSFGRVNLSVRGYRIPLSRTLEIIIAAAPKLTSDEERKAQVVVTFPDGSKRNYLLSDRGIRKKIMPSHVINYTIRISNVTSGGEFTVEVDPLNLITEWDENDNTKTFNISTQDIERRWEAELNLIADIFAKRNKSHTVVFQVTNIGRKLRPEEESNCKVTIAYPNNQLTTDLTQFTKRDVSKNMHIYTLEISDIFEGGNFGMEVDTDDAIFENNEDDNAKKVTIRDKELSLLRITSPNSPITVISGSKVNVEWQYGGQTSGRDFCLEILDSSGTVVYGPTPLYNIQTYSHEVNMPFNLGTYRVKISTYDYKNSYGVSAPIKVIAARKPPNPSGFRLTSPLPSVVQNGSTITISWETDPNQYSQIQDIEILRPDLQTSISYIHRSFIIDSSSGTSSFQLDLSPPNFEGDKADIFLKLLLQRRQANQIDTYITNLIAVRK